MSQPMQTPFGFAPPTMNAPTGTKPPTSAMVFGVLNCIFGLLAICGIGLAAVGFAFIFSGNLPPETARDPSIKLMRESQPHLIITLVMVALATIGIAMEIASGIGLFSYKEWARKLAVFYAGYSLVLGVINLVYNAAVIMPLQFEHAASLPPGPQQGGAYGGAIGGPIGATLGLIYPGLLLFFMTRPALVAYFQNALRQPTEFTPKTVEGPTDNPYRPSGF